jgi:glycosyltransferase involved in cell wall biosynthesis
VKILVFAYDLVFSGVTVNTIELAAALRDIHGHDVVLFAGPGPLLTLAEEKRLRFLPAPPAYLTVHPSISRMRALREAVRQEQPDLIYAWDWIQCLDAYYYEHMVKRVPLLVTDMSMTLQRLLPKALPKTFGTPQLVDQARAEGHHRPELLLPPVDVHENAPKAVDSGPFRAQCGIEHGDITLVTVSRLDGHMKGESLYQTMEAVAQLGHELPLKFVVVGDGDERVNLSRLADQINDRLGRAAIILTGALLDPRPAYAAADVVVGMGGSALRGMAFAKPLIVVGIRGFSAVFNAQTCPSFLYSGFYGVGDGAAGTDRLVASIRLLEEANDRTALGALSRQFVLEYFALEVVSQRLSGLCDAALNAQPRFRSVVGDGIRTAAVWVRERRFVPFGWRFGGRHSP